MRASVSGLASGRGDGSRPSSQNSRDQLVVEAQGMPLAGKILHVRVYHVSAGTPSATPLTGPLSPQRSMTPDASANSVNGSQSLGFRVLAIDDLDNEFSLFVSRQRAEYLFQSQSSSKSASKEDASSAAAPSLEAMANSIIDLLDIIGNRHRDIGKLTCREPEVHVAKRARATPTRDAAAKQKNPHLMVRNDQRATRAKKTVLRTMEAIATAQQQDITTDADHGRVSPRMKHSRKSSDESLLHRMAFSNEKSMWRSDLETNFEEQQPPSKTGATPSSSTVQVGAKIASTTPVTVGATATTTSPPRRAIPERKHKHKDLYERREKERKHRLLATRSNSASNILEPDALIDTTPSVSALALLEQPGEEEGRLKSARDSRNVRARFNAAVRTAYAVRTFLGVKTPPEPEQFLRRRTTDHSERRVFKSTDNFGAFPGMGVEITHERPEFRHTADEDDPLFHEKLRILSQAARRSSFVRDKDGNLIRRSNSSRGGSARRLSLVAVEPLGSLIASSSAPVLGVAPDPSFGVVEGDEDLIKDGFHDTQDLQEAEQENKALLPKTEPQLLLPVGSAREAIFIDNDMASDMIVADASLSAVPLGGMEVFEDGSTAVGGSTLVDATTTADPEVIVEQGLHSASNDDNPGHVLGGDDQSFQTVSDESVSSMASPLPIEVHAVTTQASALAVVIQPQCLSVSPIASTRRHTCWDEAGSVGAKDTIVTRAVDPAEPQDKDRDPSYAVGPSEQATQQPRLRPASAGDVNSTQYDLQRTEETRLCPPTLTPIERGSARADKELLPPGPGAIQSDDYVARQTAETTEASSPQWLSATELTEQPVSDNLPSGILGDDCKANPSPSASDNDVELGPPTVEPWIAESLVGREQVHEEAPLSAHKLEDVVTSQADTKAPSHDLKPEDVSRRVHSSFIPVDCDNLLDTSNGGETTSEEAEVKQIAKDDPASNRDGDDASVSDGRVSEISTAASTAVIAAAQTNTKVDSSPSSIHPHPVKLRGHPNSGSDSGPKATGNSTSPNSSQKGGPMLPRDPRHSPGKRRASVRQHPGQPLTDIKPASRRKSVVKGTFPMLPDLSGPNAVATPEVHSSGITGPKTHDDAAPSTGGSGHKLTTKSRCRRSDAKSLALIPSTYHKTWTKWVNGRGVIEKISCLQLEEQVLSGQQTGGTLVKLGLRYARWPGTSLAAILLLEHAAVLHESAPRSHEFWNSMGNAHLDIFLRNRKFLPAASFHLERCVKSLTRALAFMESMADPLLLLRFALCLFWHSEHGHLERADEIFRQLFSKFASFCDKDRVSLLFLHFQVLHRLKMFAEASKCVDEIIALVSSAPPSGPVDASSTPQSRSRSKGDEVSTALPVYELGDYWMMKMQCQQAAGDYMQATATFSRVVCIMGFVQDGSLTDEQYLELWLGIADKCFYLEDYALATEYYPVALNFAKESQLLASMHYKLGLCYQALGDSQRCVAEYKRARNMNRHVHPPVSLAELRGSYDAQFALLLDKSVRQIIEEVRVNLYDHAVRQLQRVFRLKRRAAAGGDIADSPTEVKMPSIVSRKLSRPASRSRPVSSSPHVLEAADTANANVGLEGVVADAAEPVMGLEEAEVATAARQQADFEARKLDALDQIKKLRAAAFNDVHPPGLSSNMPHATRGTTQSELLSPEKDRPEVRRLRSMATFNHLGYLPSMAPCVKHWEKLITLATDLFPTRRSITRSTCAIRSVLPRVSDEIAFCALADALGDVDSAVERLRNTSYERELSFVCTVIDVERKLEQALPVRLPSISSPSRSTKSPTPQVVSDAGRVLAPNSSLVSALSTPFQAKRSHPSSPLASPRPMRLDQMLEVQFQQRLQAKAQGTVSTPANTTQEIGGMQVLHEDFAVLRDFRQVNSTLMALQTPFGLPKPTG